MKTEELFVSKGNTRLPKCSWLPKCLGMTSWCCPHWTCSASVDQVGGVRRDCPQLRQHPPWQLSQRSPAQHPPHGRVVGWARTNPLPWHRLPFAGIIKTNFNCVKSPLRRLFLLNNYPHDTHEFLIGTDKLDWADWILKHWRSISMLTGLFKKKIALEILYIRSLRTRLPPKEWIWPLPTWRHHQWQNYMVCLEVTLQYNPLWEKS